jgi:hypothetical protein
VLVQAAAVYTLASAPLYELSSWARPLLDLALSLFVFGVLAIAQVRYRRGDMRLAVDRLRAILIGLAVTVVLFSSLLVHSSRIVWDDFLIVTLMLLAHHRLEESSVRLWNWLLDAVPAGLRAVLFEDDRGRRQ